LETVIGIGGMATVYAAVHRNRHRVAVKMLHPELSGDLAIRARFLREGYVANTIGHPGTVRVLDDDISEDGSAFLVMELLEGETAAERCLRRGGRLGLAEALHITEALLSVLAVAHDLGILHRDVKPENLFITTDAALRVLDFGVARVRQVAGSTRSGSFLGTPAFSAPEQARGRWAEVDERSDLFSAGATLFTLLTGREVHEADTPSEQLALAIGAPAPSLASVRADLPPEVCALVDRALAYDKADRWPSARAMQRAVRAALERIPSQPLAPAPRKERPSLSSWTVDVHEDAVEKRRASSAELGAALHVVPAPAAPPRSFPAVTATVAATLVGAIASGIWWISAVSSQSLSGPHWGPPAAGGYAPPSSESLGLGLDTRGATARTVSGSPGADSQPRAPRHERSSAGSPVLPRTFPVEGGGSSSEPRLSTASPQRTGPAGAETADPVFVREGEEDPFERRF
jgi:serine/threonine-protein kinase